MEKHSQSCTAKKFKRPDYWCNACSDKSAIDKARARATKAFNTELNEHINLLDRTIRKMPIGKDRSTLVSSIEMCIDLASD